MEKVQKWPVPRCAKDVRKFLGLAQYLAAFLPRLAERRATLTPLTTKDAQRDLPGWTALHQTAFQNIKDIVLSSDCLAVIYHDRRRLSKITGVKLGMSTAFHPETDGASERTNKIVNQCLRYHVTRNQTGWVRALPRVRFAIMNTVSKSTGFSPFQFRYPSGSFHAHAYETRVHE